MLTDLLGVIGARYSQHGLITDLLYLSSRPPIEAANLVFLFLLVFERGTAVAPEEGVLVFAMANSHRTHCPESGASRTMKELQMAIMKLYNFRNWNKPFGTILVQSGPPAASEVRHKLSAGDGAVSISMTPNVGDNRRTN
jgi:hypothetical protein